MSKDQEESSWICRLFLKFILLQKVIIPEIEGKTVGIDVFIQSLLNKETMIPDTICNSTCIWNQCSFKINTKFNSDLKTVNSNPIFIDSSQAWFQFVKNWIFRNNCHSNMSQLLFAHFKVVFCSSLTLLPKNKCC